LVWSSAGAGSNAVSRSIASHATGIYYMEVTYTTAPGGYNVGVGVANATQSLNTAMGTTNNSCEVYNGDATVYLNNGSIGSLSGAPAQGDVVGMDVDVTGRLIRFRLNGGAFTSWLDISPITGDLFAAAHVNGAATTSITTNFGATAYQTSIPVGSSNW